MASPEADQPLEAAGELRFQFPLTVADYRYALYFSALGRSRARMLIYGAAWLFSVLALGLDYFQMVPPMNRLTRIGLFFAAILGPCLLLMQEFAVFRFQKVLARTTKASRDILFNADGVEFLRERRPGGNFEPWSAFGGAVLTPRLLILYLDSRHMVYIPRTCAPEARWRQAAALLRLKLGRRYKEAA